MITVQAMRIPSHYDDEAIIQSLWANEECIDLNSVQFGTGEVVLLDVPDDIPDETTSIRFRVKGRIPARDAIRLPGVTLSAGLSASAEAPVLLEELGLRITGGECAAYGTFGFVAVSRISDDYLVWLAFFLNSNPFVTLSSDGTSVVAKNNLGARYVFPLDRPHGVQVAAASEVS